MTERVLAVTVYPLRPRFARPPLPKGEARKAPRLALPLGELSPQATERALAVTVYPLRLRFAQTPLPKGEARGGYMERKFLAQICQSARERSKKTEAVFLVGSRRSGGKSKSLRAPNRKPAQRLRFGKEEMSTEDKRRRSRRLVPPWSFLTRCVFFWRSKRKCCAAPANL